MALSNGVTEIADSEDEPMTSSPVCVTAEAVVPAHQAPQESPKATVCTHQAVAARAVDEASEQAEALYVNRDNASIHSDSSKSHPTDLTLDVAPTSRQEGATVEASHHTIAEPTPEHSSQPPSDFSSIPVERRVSTDSSQLSARVSALAGSSRDLSTPHPDTDQMLKEETTSAAVPNPANEIHGPMTTDATQHRQEHPSTFELFPNQANSAQVQEERRVMENKPSGRPEIGEGQTTREQNTADNVVSPEATNTAAETQPYDTTTCRSQDLIVNETSPAVQLVGSNQVMLQTNRDRANATQSTSPTVPESAETQSVESDTERHSPDAEGSSVTQTPVAEGSHQLKSGLDQAMHLSDTTCNVKTEIIAQIQSAGTDEQKRSQGANPSTTMNPENPANSQERSSRTEGILQTEESEDQSIGVNTKDSMQTESSTSTVRVSHSQPSPSIQPSPSSVALAIPQTPQEITLAELKAQKAALLASLRALPAIQVLIEETASADAGAGDGDDDPTAADIMTAANKIVKEHIKLLHEYNELKDVGQGLMGLIADQRGARIVEVQEEFGIDAQD